jgi:hypothetical protein
VGTAGEAAVCDESTGVAEASAHKGGGRLEHFYCREELVSGVKEVEVVFGVV